MIDALVPAFIAALLIRVSDRPAWLAAILKDRFSRLPMVFAGIVLAEVILAVFALGFAGMVRPMLNPDARSLMVGLAFLFAGGGALLPLHPPSLWQRWRIGALPLSLAAYVAVGAGDRSQFVTAAIAAHGAYPVAAGIGAVAGGIVAVLPALALGEAAWCRLPWRPVRIATGIMFLAIGAVIGARLL